MHSVIHYTSFHFVNSCLPLTFLQFMRNIWSYGSCYTWAYHSLIHAANYGEVCRKVFLEHFNYCSYIIVKQFVKH